MVTTQLLGKDYLSAGDKVGNFELLEIIGGGGEGAIWSARNQENDQLVALKFFNMDTSELNIQKRMDHLKILSELSHPNVRRVFKMDGTGGLVYFVMRYYPSGSLSDLIQFDPLPLDQVLKIGAQITSALEYIHGIDVIHRDLKPSNVLLDHQMHCYLTDFGIARRISQSTLAMHTGQGTPAYSSPEQHTRDYIGHQTDIYSFGIMMYELFTGGLPFQGMSSLAIRQLERKVDIPDPRGVNPDLPLGLHEVLIKITSADLDVRPKDIREAFDLILSAFNRSGQPISGLAGSVLSYESILRQVPPKKDDEQSQLKEAQNILRLNLSRWLEAEGRYRIRLTSFFYLSKVFSSQKNFMLLSKDQISFMAYSAIVHGQNLSFWWGKVNDPAERLKISERIFELETGDAVLNMMKLIMLEPYQFTGADVYSQKLIPPLLEQFEQGGAPEITTKALVLLDTLMPQAEEWQAYALSAETDQKLAQLSLVDEIFAEQAARLVGKLKSRSAVNWILGGTRTDQSENAYQALSIIRETAGSLPENVGFAERARTWLNIAAQQLSENRRGLARLYLFAALGVGLGLAFHVFGSTRVPSWLDATRILNSIGSMVLFGPLIGIGLFASRWIVQRLKVMNIVPRTIFGVVLGGLLLNLGFNAFHFLFLSSNPEGVLILLGSLLIALGFGLGDALGMAKWLRMLIGTVAVAAALYFTFEVGSLQSLSPMLYYEYTQPVRTGVLIIGFSAIVGIITQLASEDSYSDLLEL